MMQTFDPVCLDAFTRLLSQPDPADLPARSHLPANSGLRLLRPTGTG
jgi:hypothetical protein